MLRPPNGLPLSRGNRTRKVYRAWGPRAAVDVRLQTGELATATCGCASSRHVDFDEPLPL